MDGGVDEFAKEIAPRLLDQRRVTAGRTGIFENPNGGVFTSVFWPRKKKFHCRRVPVFLKIGPTSLPQETLYGPFPFRFPVAMRPEWA